MVPFLFPEITDVIVDNLHTDKSSLRACGLTARTWLPSSRYHLFSRVTLRPSNILSFTKLLEYPLNNIAPVVRHLAVELEIDENNTILGASGLVLPLLPSITAHLRMIRSLSLARIDWSLCSPEILQNTLSNLGGVEALELNRVAVRGPEGAVDLLCAFPLLKNISIDDLHYGVGYHHSSTLTRHQPRPSFVIYFIDLHMPPPIALMAWLLKPTPIIHAIRCMSLVMDYDNFLAKILASAGATIRHIEIDLNAGFGQGILDNTPLINITKCTKLQSIYFRQIYLSEDLGSMNRVFVPPILDQVSSPSFEVLSLCFLGVGSPVDEWNIHFDWKGVAERLLQPQFANLKRVYVKWPISGLFQASDVESFFANGPFSPITKRGLVQLKLYVPEYPVR